MRGELEPDFEFEPWGPDRGLKLGHCGHCNRSVRFDPIEEGSGFNVTSPDDYGDDVENTFLLGRCPHPPCRRVTIFHRIVSKPAFGGDFHLQHEEVIFPRTSVKRSLPDEIPPHLRTLFEEAEQIEKLSPNSVCFLARRILEQALREKTDSRKRLEDLINEFPEMEGVTSSLAHLVRRFGNIACHPKTADDGDWVDVDPQEATAVLGIVFELLDFLYVRPTRHSRLLARADAKANGKKPDALPSANDKKPKTLLGS